MKGSKFLLSAVAAKLHEAYIKGIAEYRQVLPLALSVAVDAPNDYATLQNEAAEGILRVSPEHSDSSIYGFTGNMAFRTFHDYGHVLYHKEFTLLDECALARIQWKDIVGYIDPEWRDICEAVYLADTVEQSLFESQTGAFPVDQKAFVLGHLHNWLEVRYGA